MRKVVKHPGLSLMSFKVRHQYKVCYARCPRCGTLNSTTTSGSALATEHYLCGNCGNSYTENSW